MGGAGGVTVGKECLFVGLAAGLVEREVPVGVRAEVVQPAQWEFLVAWQVAGDVAVPAVPADGDLLQLGPLFGCVEVQLFGREGLQAGRGNRHGSMVADEHLFCVGVARASACTSWKGSCSPR